MPQRKLVRLLTRRADMSPEQFQARWARTQPALLRAAPAVARYVQSVPLLQGYAKGPMIVDGLDEVWFESDEAMARGLASDAWRAVLDDLAEFCAAAPTLMPVDVHVIKDNPIPSPAVKNVEFVNRRPGMALAPFRAYWREVHGPIACHIPPLVRYEQNHLAAGEYEKTVPPRFDGLAITWFRSTADMRAGATTPEYATTRADEPNFLPDGHLPIIITQERAFW